MSAAALLAGLLLGAAQADELELPRLEHRWGLAQGLMAGIVVSHAVQPLAVLTGDLAWKDKHVVAISGAALYGASFGGMMARKRWSLWIAIGGPVVGITSITGAWILGSAGLIEAEVRPDVFQLAGGLLQVPAAALSWSLLRDDPRLRREPSVWLQVRPPGEPGELGGLEVAGVW